MVTRHYSSSFWTFHVARHSKGYWKFRFFWNDSSVSLSAVLLNIHNASSLTARIPLATKFSHLTQAYSRWKSQSKTLESKKKHIISCFLHCQLFGILWWFFKTYFNFSLAYFKDFSSIKVGCSMRNLTFKTASFLQATPFLGVNVRSSLAISQILISRDLS